MYGEGKTEAPEQIQAPTESKTEETAAAPAVTETKEAAPVAAADKERKGKDSVVGDLTMIETNSNFSCAAREHR